jgi:hypothetical protein
MFHRVFVEDSCAAQRIHREAASRRAWAETAAYPLVELAKADITSRCTRRRPHYGFSEFNVSPAATAGERGRSAPVAKGGIAMTIGARSLVVCLACPILVSCRAAAEPRALLEKAIEAHGGEENLKKARKGILKGIDKGTGDGTMAITQEEFFDLPKRWKRSTSGVINDKRRTSFLLAVDGRFWQWEEGDAAKETKNEAEAKPHLALLETLLELRDTKLSAIKGVDVQGRATAAFRAEKDQNPGEFYFAKDTGLLVQLNFKWQSEPGKQFETKLVLSEYREVDGVKLPFRRIYYIKGGGFNDFTLLSDFKVNELKFVDKLPDNAFALP